MEKNRLYYLDTMKGILIILVVLGHAIQSTIPDYQHNFLFRLIYSFHMPLFFLISGYLTLKEKHDENIIYKRGVQCIIPFIIWAFLLPYLEEGIFDIKRTVKILIFPDNGLWFLYNLFVYCVVFNLSESLSIKTKKVQIFFVIAFLFMFYLLMYLFHNKLNLSQICWFFPFFAIGYYIHKYIEFFKRNINLVILLGGIFYCCSVPFWMIRENPLFYQYINLGSTFSFIFRYSVQIIGSMFFFFLGMILLKRHLTFFRNVGTKTLGIYAFQFVVLFYLEKVSFFGSNYLKILFLTISASFISYFLVILVNKIKFVRLLLIGKR